MNYFEAASSYLTAKFSGTAIPEKQLNRLAVCFSCEYLLDERRNDRGELDAKGEKVQNPYYYCKECGCPKTKYWPDSELRKKVTFNKAKCPKGKWQE